MARSKVISKYQVTIPKEVREKVDVRPGEMVSVDALSREGIIVRLYPRTANSLETLIGKKPASRTIGIGELEEKMESK